ncbi:SPOR domain-containing protein [Celeribacter arenosi]
MTPQHTPLCGQTPSLHPSTDAGQTAPVIQKTSVPRLTQKDTHSVPVTTAQGFRATPQTLGGQTVIEPGCRVNSGGTVLTCAAHTATPGTYELIWLPAGSTARRADGTRFVTQEETLVRRAIKGSPEDADAPYIAEIDADLRYVQIGAFGVPDNAERSIQRLAALGLPVSSQMLNRGNAALKIVLAGPFDRPERTLSALGELRRAGYEDAFARK